MYVSKFLKSIVSKLVTVFVMSKVIVLTGIAITFLSCQVPAEYSPPETHSEVEISPGTFVVVAKQDWTVDDPRNRGAEKTRLLIRYHEMDVHWQGVEIPVTLRELDGRLYMAGYDRTKLGRNPKSGESFSYFRQEVDHLIAIDRHSFPKSLATQNMWTSSLDDLGPVLRLDTSDVGFRQSANALMWEHLMTGKISGATVDTALLDEFVQKYSPTKLTTIRRATEEKKGHSGFQNLQKPRNSAFPRALLSHVRQ